MWAGTPIWCRISVTVSSSESSETGCGRLAPPAARSTRLTSTFSSNGFTKKNEKPLSKEVLLDFFALERAGDKEGGMYAAAVLFPRSAA